MLVESRRIRDRYRLLEPIGGGAMGTVWRAQDEKLDRTVAIKELLLPHDHDEQRTQEAKNRAMREARIAARLQHSHAITVFAVLEEEDRPWLVMEYLPSKSLSTVLSERGTLSPRDVASIGRYSITLVLRSSGTTPRSKYARPSAGKSSGVPADTLLASKSWASPRTWPSSWVTVAVM